MLTGRCTVSIDRRDFDTSLCAARDIVDRLYPSPHRRPWWWWLAFWFYASATVTALWVMYRTVAGHPILGGLLVRLGG